MCEFFRYVLVGGLAFVVDFCVLWLSRTFLLFHLDNTGILLATALGFAAGLVFNYVLSLMFVFRQNSQHAKQHKIRSFVLFAVIGIVGLLITETLMFTGIYFLGDKWYLTVKIVASGIVLMWNYIARKLLIFRKMKRGIFSEVRILWRKYLVRGQVA
jgi:putative flippase GtrA